MMSMPALHRHSLECTSSYPRTPSTSMEEDALSYNSLPIRFDSSIPETAVPNIPDLGSPCPNPSSCEDLEASVLSNCNILLHLKYLFRMEDQRLPDHRTDQQVTS